MAQGDHVYYFRAGGTYSHHGLDCGDGTVIHFESSPWMKLAGCFSSNRPPQITRTSLSDFAQGHEVLIRSYDDEMKVDEPVVAMERAETRIGETGYDVFGNNCEHFVVWCKTGVAKSSQVNAHRKAADAVVKGAPVGAFLLRVARRVPGPYRGIATMGAIGVAGAVYLGTYVQHRVRNMNAGLS